MLEKAHQVTPETLGAYFDAFNRHDIDALLSFMTEDCVFETAVGPEEYGVRHTGHGTVGAAFAQVWAAMPDAHWEQKNHLVAGDRGVSEWTFTGTRSDGKRMEAQGCDLFTFRDGKIAVKQAFRKERPLLPAKEA